MIETKNCKVLVDCGFHQGQDEERHEGEPFSYSPSDIDAVLLTHAHIDHSGRIPLLVKNGFKGKIYCTYATAELVEILWNDSARIMQEDSQWKTRKNLRRGLDKVEPLYGEKEVEKALKLRTPISYDEVTEIFPGLNVRFREAGHILGSSIIETWISDEGEEKPVKVVFSGDLGPFDGVIEKPPTLIEEADLVLIESTYGDRNHKSLEETRAEFQSAIKDALGTSAKILVPTFVVDRAQRMLYEFKLFQKEFPNLKMPSIYLDSPMGVKTTEIYSKYVNLLSRDLKDLLVRGEDPFEPEKFQFIRTAEESRAVNDMRSGIILAGSGMCSGGRIMHHLKHNLFKSDTHVFFVGYQAYGTLGRRLVDGAKEIRIAGEDVEVKAKFHTLNGFSAHADRDDLLKWASAFPAKTKFLVVHGEPSSSAALAMGLKDKGYISHVPSIEEVIDLGSSAEKALCEKETCEPRLVDRMDIKPQDVSQMLSQIMSRAEELHKIVYTSKDYRDIMPLLISARVLLEMAAHIEKKGKK